MNAVNNVKTMLAVCGVVIVALAAYAVFGRRDDSSNTAANTMLLDQVTELIRSTRSLQRRLEAVEARMLLARPQFGALGPREQGTAAVIEKPTKETRSSDARTAGERDKESVQKTKDFLEAKVREEPFDQTWTGNAQAALGKLLAQPKYEGTAMEGVDCRTSVCRFEVRHTGAEAFMAFRDGLSQPPFQGGERFFTYDKESKRTMVYASRHGAHLPQLHATAEP